MLNRNYGKLRDDARIMYAPSEVKVGNTYYPAPTAEQYAACGYLPIDSAKPENEGSYFVPTEYGYVVDGRIVRRYDERPIVEPPQVVRYSKLKLIVASKAAGKWEAFKAFIAQAGYEDEWNAAQFLSSGYAQFEQAKTAIIAAGIATAEEIEEILAESVDEEVGA